MPFPPLVGLLLFWQGAAGSLDVLVVDGSNRPVSGVRVELKAEGAAVSTTQTDESGHATFRQLKLARYELDASKDGFEPVQKADFELPASLTLTLAPLARKESIEVKGAAAPLDAGASVPNEVPAKTAAQLPGHPATVADALPLLPGVVRVPGGGLVMSAAGEHRSALIVNSADVTDPATGQFGLTVPIDSVETISVFQTPFLAEYGRFTAGVVSVQTKRGGDQWKWEFSDPFPDFIIRSYHLRGLRDATPRLNVEGPIVPGKLYFSEGLEYAVRKTEVYELPFPFNEKKQEGINSFAQLDWVVSQTQLVTATVHVAPQRMEYVNLNYFNPQETSPDAATNNYTGTLADKLTLGAGLFENTLSVTRFDARVWGQGTEELTITPDGNSGNYFAQQHRNASRVSWTPVYSFGAVKYLGTHNFKAGAYFAESTDNGEVTERPFNILDSSNQLLERVAFTAGQPFRNQDMEYAFFGQDHWAVSRRLALDLGIRTESQALSESFRVAPRAGIAWTPFGDKGTVVRAGFGFFYDRVPLSVYSFDQYPSEIITTFGPAGQITAGPSLYQNGLGTVNSKFPFVFEELEAGNFSPRSATGNVQVEQPLSHQLMMRVGYTQKQSSGLVILNPVAPSPENGGVGANLLSGTGQSQYHQFEVTARLRLNEKRQLFFSYVHARARGDLNDFANYLGSFPVPIVRPNQFGNLAADLPNRFLTWGVVQLPGGFRIAPLIEFRSGFPYAMTDAYQNYVGVPNAQRFPTFVSVDSRFSKDVKMNSKYTVRLSVSSYNLTNHFNPEAIHNNVADPAFGLFFGQRGRRFTADFDVIF
jgi:carboxypeptidase family protein